jgi:thymidylate synthase ThyX
LGLSFRPDTAPELGSVSSRLVRLAPCILCLKPAAGACYDAAAMSDANSSHPPQTSAAPAIEVYAVYGAEPEVQAYAMAKYSRSALSMKESLREINEQRAEKFLNTFYFQYGHRSIADLAHLAIAVEKLSILAAIALVDEKRWDGQERSTRYQDFKRGGYFVPDYTGLEMCELRYRDTIAMLFAEYEALSETTWHHLA